MACNADHYQRHSFVTPVTDRHRLSCQAGSVIPHIIGRKLAAGVVMLVLTVSGTFVRMPGSPDSLHVAVLKSSPGSQFNTGHPCCHSSAAASFEIALPASMPCGSEHACCLRPAPTNSANLPSTRSGQRSETRPAAWVGYRPNLPGYEASVRNSSPFTYLPYAELSTILRI